MVKNSHIEEFIYGKAETKVKIREAAPHCLDNLKYDHLNVINSPSCVLCWNKDGNSTPVNNDPDLPRHAHVTVLNNTLGGDLEAIARFLGLTGPNGTCFCDFCEVKLKDVQKGKPHAPIIFPRYSLHCDKVNYNYKERTLEDLINYSKEFAENKDPKLPRSKFNNCEFPPLISPVGPLIDHVTVPPLHIGLRIGLQIVNIIEQSAIEIDLKIRQAKGLTTQPVIDAINEIKKGEK